MDEKQRQLEQLYSQIFKITNPNFDDSQEIKDTPKRAAKAILEQTQGYDQDPYQICKDAIFKSPNQQLIIVNNITVNSMCEHHMLPFYGICHIGYVPKQQILGLSKFSRLVEIFSRRFQVQEKLANDIKQFIIDLLDPSFVVVYIECQHMCMKHRGVKEQNSKMKTIIDNQKGDQNDLVQQFLNLI